MKKVTIAFLLACVLTGGAFAQVTFSGSVYAGIQFQSADDTDESITTTYREGHPPRFDFMVTAMRENYGARLDTRFQMTDDPDGHFSLRGIYGWVDFPGFSDDDAFRLTVGQITSTPWVLSRFHSMHSEIKFGDVRGFRLEYTTPIQGLSIGAAVRAAGDGLQRTAEQMIFGVTYIHPLFNTIFAYDLAGNVRTLFGFNFTGISDLTAGIQLHAERLASWDDPAVGYPGVLQIRYKLGYRVLRPFNVFLIFGQRIHGTSGAGAEWEITPGIEYRFLPNLTGSLSVTLDNYRGNPDNNLTVRAGIEHTLRGPAIFYVEYELRLDNMENPAHSFGFGITLRAF